MPESTIVTLWHPRSGLRCLVKFIPGEVLPDGGCNVRAEYSFRRSRGLPPELPQLAAQVQAWTDRAMRCDFDLPSGWRFR